MTCVLDLTDGPPVQETLICFVLDASQSMDSCRAATISGFNEYVATVKARPEPALLTLYVFNSEQIRKVYDAQAIQQVEDLSTRTFRPHGMTPLYDAIKQAIEDLDAVIAARGDSPPVLFSIMTDGQENCSQTTTREDIMTMIQAREARGWTFAYLGANQDAWQVGTSLGIPVGNTQTYSTDRMAGAMRGLGMATACYLQSGSRSSSRLFADDASDNHDPLARPAITSTRPLRT